MPAGYYRSPTIHRDTIVFVCEDDLWTVSANGGIARRLTAAPGEESTPRLSPDGEWLAFVGEDEGSDEVYIMPALGGAPKRLTHLGASCLIAGWMQPTANEPARIVFASDVDRPFHGMMSLYALDPARPTEPQPLGFGPARAVAFAPASAKGAKRGVVIGRNTGDPARWKRYRGGTAGRLWIDPKQNGDWRPLIELDSNLAWPMWLDDNRVYFISDHEGVGNLYSCTPAGKQLRRHTHHADFYVRNATSDGRRIVYHAGADLFVFDAAANTTRMVSVDWRSPQTQRNRKFARASASLDGYAISPKGERIAITARGKLFVLHPWDGAVTELGGNGVASNARLRLPVWTADDELVAVTDEGGEETLVAYAEATGWKPKKMPPLDTGRITAMKVNPKKSLLAFTNHRYELMVIEEDEHENESVRLIDRGASEPIEGFDWSPDGEWLAYGCPISTQRTAIKLWNATSGETRQITNPILIDSHPSFDHAGKYLFFLSHRIFDPVYDNMQFELSFPSGMVACLLTLQKDTLSPFGPQPPEKKPDKKPDDKADGKKDDKPSDEKKPDDKTDKPKDEPKLVIDLDGIENRVVTFPLPEGRYYGVAGMSDGKKVYILLREPRSALNDGPSDEPRESGATLILHDMENRSEEPIAEHVSSFTLSGDGNWLAFWQTELLSVLRAGATPAESGPPRRRGWVNLERIKVEVNPGAEWQQMFREAWRLQRDQFWAPDMSQVDWNAVHDRYLPLVDRVSSRAEFSDLMWEMQGELGTSHCYEYGGDYRPNYRYIAMGYLGASFEWDEAAGAWRIARAAKGDTWLAKTDSPLNAPGVNVKVGDHLFAVNGQPLTRTFSPGMALVNQSHVEVALQVSGPPPADAQPATAEPQPPARRTVIVKTLRDDTQAWYRDWVESNRRHVQERGGGRVGYIHVPDMGPRGFAEFHRSFLAELERVALIVDVRYNRGGNVSQLILEKLARKRIGYSISRWGKTPMPYPMNSVLGPLVALTNESAGSDGDIFSHGFKLMALGPLIGTRTWGGVIGIRTQHALADGTMTTQPEHATWFRDIDWQLENFGAQPDIVVDNTPQDWARGVDAQLDRAIAEVLRLLEANPPELPTFDARPSRALPTLKVAR